MDKVAGGITIIQKPALEKQFAADCYATIGGGVSARIDIWAMHPAHAVEALRQIANTIAQSTGKILTPN